MGNLHGVRGKVQLPHQRQYLHSETKRQTCLNSFARRVNVYYSLARTLAQPVNDRRAFGTAQADEPSHALGRRWPADFENNVNSRRPVMRVVIPRRPTSFGDSSCNHAIQSIQDVRRPDSHELPGGIAYDAKCASALYPSCIPAGHRPSIDLRRSWIKNRMDTNPTVAAGFRWMNRRWISAIILTLAPRTSACLHSLLVSNGCETSHSTLFERNSPETGRTKE